MEFRPDNFNNSGLGRGYSAIEKKGEKRKDTHVARRVREK